MFEIIQEFNLEELLKKQGRKKRWLAEQLAVTETTIGRWCSNQNAIPKVKIARIKELLGVE